MQNKQIPLIPQGTKLLVPKEELKAKLDNITALYLANLDRLAIAINLLTADQLAEYRSKVEATNGTN